MSLELLEFLEKWQYLWIFVGSFATAVLAGFLVWQVWLQNRTTKLAYMPSIIPRQSQIGNKFTLKQIQNIGNGSAKYITVKITNLSNNTTKSVTMLGMTPGQKMNLDVLNQIHGEIGDEIEIKTKFKDVDNKSHIHKDKIKISDIFKVEEE